MSCAFVHAVYMWWQLAVGLYLKVHNDLNDLTEEEEAEEESAMLLDQKQNINDIQLKNTL